VPVILVTVFHRPRLSGPEDETQCVTGAGKAVHFGLGPAQAVILGAITGIGGGMLRDVLLREIPTILCQER
jgi:uncharacterized membrane protein YeiH